MFGNEFKLLEQEEDRIDIKRTAPVFRPLGLGIASWVDLGASRQSSPHHLCISLAIISILSWKRRYVWTMGRENGGSNEDPIPILGLMNSVRGRNELLWSLLC